MAGRQGPYPIDELDLPTRTRNALVRAGLTTPEDLAAHSDAELLLLRGIGPTGLAQVRERLAAWERERPADELALAEGPGAEPDDGDTTGLGAPALLPGRQVLHATWLPGPPGRLFLWGEGKPLPLAICNPQSAICTHPFHVPPAALRDALPDLTPADVDEAWTLAHLPATGGGPQPSPQLIRDFLAEEPGEPESLGLWRVDGLPGPPCRAGGRPALLVAGGQTGAGTPGPAAICAHPSTSLS
jgi:hypothetical protein